MARIGFAVAFRIWAFWILPTAAVLLKQHRCECGSLLQHGRQAPCDCSALVNPDKLTKNALSLELNSAVPKAEEQITAEMQKKGDEVIAQLESVSIEKALKESEETLDTLSSENVGQLQSQIAQEGAAQAQVAGKTDSSSAEQIALASTRVSGEAEKWATHTSQVALKETAEQGEKTIAETLKDIEKVRAETAHTGKLAVLASYEAGQVAALAKDAASKMTLADARSNLKLVNGVLKETENLDALSKRSQTQARSAASLAQQTIGLAQQSWTQAEVAYAAATKAFDQASTNAQNLQKLKSELDEVVAQAQAAQENSWKLTTVAPSSS